MRSKFIKLRQSEEEEKNTLLLFLCKDVTKNGVEENGHVTVSGGFLGQATK